MNAVATAARQQPGNVVTLAIEPKPKLARKKHRFRIIEFINHTGSKSWRVDGYILDRSRVRENFADLKTAQCRQLELEAESLKQPLDTAVRATKLSEEALRVCEFACLKLGEDWKRLPDAVDFWLKAGGKSIPVDGPRIDDAIGQYLNWLEKSSNLRVPTQKGRRVQLNVFRNAVANVRVSEIDPEFVERYLDGRKVGPVTKNFINRQLSVFFGWCVQRPRRWMTANPCREIKIDTGEKSAPKILTVDECRAILSAAE